MGGSTGNNRRVRKVASRAGHETNDQSTGTIPGSTAGQSGRAVDIAPPDEEANYAAPERYPRRASTSPPSRARSRDTRGAVQGSRRNRRPVDRYVVSIAAVALALVLAVLVYILLTERQSGAGTAPMQVPDTGSNNAAAVSTKVPAKNEIAVDLTATPVDLFAVGAGGTNRGQLRLPRGIALSAQGNIYVADTQNLRIQEFDKTGKFATMFGSKGFGEGQFNTFAEDSVGTGPGGLAVDAAGNVYVADTWNHRVQKFSSDGKFLTMWGGVINLVEAPAGAAQENNSKFYGPRGVATGPDGSVYVTDTGNKRVLIFDPDGKFLRKIESGVTVGTANNKFDKPGELNEPIGIAVDGGGNVFAADTRNNRIQKFGPDGKPLAQWAVPTGSWAPGPYLEPFLTLDSAGNLYATAPSSSSVIKFNPQGEVVGQKKAEGSQTLKTPTGIAVTPDGTLYVVDTGADAVVNLGKMP